MPAIEPPASLHFVSIVEQVISPVLRADGFRVSERTEIYVQFVRADRAVSFSYSPEDVPSPWVSIMVGLMPDYDARPEYVALWRAIPAAEPASHYPTWRFTRDGDLADLLRRLYLEVLLPFAKPLWDDEGRIRDLLAQQYLEAQHHYEQVSRTQALSMARHLYEKGDLPGAVVAYGLIDPAHLTAADRRKVALATRTDRGH